MASYLLIVIVIMLMVTVIISMTHDNDVDVDILRMYIIYYIYSAGWRRCPAWTGRPTRRRRVSPCSIPWALSEHGCG